MCLRLSGSGINVEWWDGYDAMLHLVSWRFACRNVLSRRPISKLIRTLVCGNVVKSLLRMESVSCCLMSPLVLGVRGSQPPFLVS